MPAGPESLLPPLVAITLAIISRRVVLPLAAGVWTGAWLLARRDADHAWTETPWLFYNALVESVFSTSHLQALLFSLLLGGMVGVLEKGGGMRALIERLSARVRTRCGAQTMVAISGLAIFFDDYSNTLLVGGTMRTTVDRFGVSREKLAYLVDSTAAPVAGLSVVSTWAAIEISYMADGLAAAGIHDPSAAFEMFIQSIPYRFYPWIAVILVMLVSITGRDFGPMRKAEVKAAAKTERRKVAELDDRDSDTNDESRRHKWLWAAAVIPVLVCLLAVGVVLVITGFAAMPTPKPGVGWLRLAGQLLGNGDSYLALIAGGGAGMLVAIRLHVAMRGCDIATALRASLGGAAQMLPAMLILWFAWALSTMTEPDHLDTGGYLAGVLSERLDSRMLPTVVFLLAGAIAFATGTSWGTMGILTPLSISLALQLDPAGGPSGAIALSTCGAVLAGAIFGDHCSPISDTTVLSSRASGCDHLAHVRTQMPYAVVAAVACILGGTLPAAVGISPWICLAISTILVGGFLYRFGIRPAAITENETDVIREPITTD
ncbi:Malate-2H(+)/Na(+)-lactate antiporter [Rubripirellula tenax]|uniref:Malate-2H(+)/Na(+)-lactate antiporter n=1 Tax=Rubripirellula tenax TaxID=2528015 RepID=A0A5C6ER69_9BACT|nr:Na+/H+ antiporter NhaC family protein [Rubripirellula tenax]TWU50884.1 Malate-2H(+)/Na(+)-lactate antiporter [Rubripirellula tenax]